MAPCTTTSRRRCEACGVRTGTCCSSLSRKGCSFLGHEISHWLWRMVEDRQTGQKRLQHYMCVKCLVQLFTIPMRSVFPHSVQL